MELKYLVNLKHLLLRYTDDLSVIPSGVISSLAELEELDLYESRDAEWEVMEGEGDVGASFDELEKNQNLKSLGITIKAVPTLAKLLRLSYVSIRRLCTKRLSSPNLATPVQLTPQIIPPHICKSLEEFMLYGFTGSRQLSLENPDGQSWCLGNLESLAVTNLWDLEAIIWKGAVAQEFLPNVRSLKLFGCYKLKNASWILHLPRLEFVHFYYCVELTHIIDDLEDGQGEIRSAELVRTFPRLNKFVLESLPNLRSIAGQPLAFPSLEHIEVNRCDKLEKLPFQPQITDSLREIRGSKNWWEGLEWDNDSIKSSLQSHFRTRK
ncbi:disease resistance protein RPS2-like [Elaeis guineensis]|uniref:disease resistance protein RPS2-like n=1 Tax=Elaeis guineensis var. tenera TaxID=51953 RepID=UPI003C6D05D8